MSIPLLGELFSMPSDVISAWILTIIMGAFLTIYVLKKKKLPIIWDYMRTTNHRKIGTLYILFGILFFLRAGIDSLLIRTQLAVPNNDFWVFQGDKYNELFTKIGRAHV